MTDKRPDRTIGNVPDGMQPVLLARLLEERLKADPQARVGVVFVARKTPDLLKAIPASLEGYPVAVEETGELRPFEAPPLR